MDICCICLENPKFPDSLDCGHIFCKECISNLKNFYEGNRSIDPCTFGAPRCPCNTNTSCINRPCNTTDINIMKKWEQSQPREYQDWTIKESIQQISHTQKFRCPLCRKE